MTKTTEGIDGLAAKIKALRKAHGLTQEELGKMAGVSESQISYIEAGTSIPPLRTLERIAVALNCTILDVLSQPSAIDKALVPIADKLASLPLEERRVFIATWRQDLGINGALDGQPAGQPTTRQRKGGRDNSGKVVGIDTGKRR